MMLIWLVPVIVIILLVGRGGAGCCGHSHHGHQGGGDALEVLRLRLARGEITPEEYDRLREKIQTP